MANKIIDEFPLETPFKTDTLDLSNGRFYTQRNVEPGSPDKVYMPSVTTILKVIYKGEGFDRWLGNASSYKDAMEYADQAATIGSIVHALCMRLLWGEVIDTKDGFFDEYTETDHKLDDRVNKRLIGFCKFVEDHQLEVVANEMSLFNPRKHEGEVLYPYAGQVDQVYKIDGKFIMCDIKTGAEYSTHGLQLTAYKLIWDSLFPQYKIDEMWGLYLSDSWIKKPYKIKKYNFQPEDWLNAVDLWRWSRGAKNLEPRFRKELETRFELNLNNKELTEDGV